MLVGNRSFKKIFRAFSKKVHYVALFNSFKVYKSPLENLYRYLSGNGKYPYLPELMTPVGVVKPTLYSHHDILTVNEIFCRLDYKASEKLSVVVDLGSNIGISALYFLSRNSNCKCYLFEPDQRNIVKLKGNLSRYKSRYFLTEKAVSDEKGYFDFNFEETGRYGGLGEKSDNSILIEVLEINDVLNEVLSKEDFIDILKIDTEGVEERCVRKISDANLKKIKTIYIEASPSDPFFPELFDEYQYGCVYVLKNKSYSV